jgi:hypothetical protein
LVSNIFRSTTGGNIDIRQIPGEVFLRCSRCLPDVIDIGAYVTEVIQLSARYLLLSLGDLCQISIICYIPEVI